MKKIKLTEADLTRIIERVINEQDEEEILEEQELNITVLEKKVNDLQTRLDELEDDYMRKIGYGDHHQHPPPL